MALAGKFSQLPNPVFDPKNAGFGDLIPLLVGKGILAGVADVVVVGAGLFRFKIDPVDLRFRLTAHRRAPEQFHVTGLFCRGDPRKVDPVGGDLHLSIPSFTRLKHQIPVDHLNPLPIGKALGFRVRIFNRIIVALRSPTVLVCKDQLVGDRPALCIGQDSGIFAVGICQTFAVPGDVHRQIGGIRDRVIFGGSDRLIRIEKARVDERPVARCDPEDAVFFSAHHPIPCTAPLKL